MPGRWAAPPAPGDDGLQAPACGGFGVGKHVVGHAVGRDHAGLVRDAELLKNLHCVLHGVPVAAGTHDHADLDGFHGVWGVALRRLRLLRRCRWNPRFYFLRPPTAWGCFAWAKIARNRFQGPMAHTIMIDVTVENFEAEVVAASMNVPVLVDFWAPWCGPCKSLGPVLEKLETEYAGRFKLAKIDSDQEQQLAGMFGIRSIPTCVLLMNGQPVDGFMGALPEGQVRAFLDKHVPIREEALEAEAEEEEALDALEKATPRPRWKSCSTLWPPTLPTTTPALTTSSCCCNWAATTTPRWPSPP
jgi:thioredoxin